MTSRKKRPDQLPPELYDDMNIINQDAVVFSNDIELKEWIIFTQSSGLSYINQDILPYFTCSYEYTPIGSVLPVYIRERYFDSADVRLASVEWTVKYATNHESASNVFLSFVIVPSGDVNIDVNIIEYHKNIEDGDILIYYADKGDSECTDQCLFYHVDFDITPFFKWDALSKRLRSSVHNKLKARQLATTSSPCVDPVTTADVVKSIENDEAKVSECHSDLPVVKLKPVSNQPFNEDEWDKMIESSDSITWKFGYYPMHFDIGDVHATGQSLKFNRYVVQDGVIYVCPYLITDSADSVEYIASFESLITACRPLRPKNVSKKICQSVLDILLKENVNVCADTLIYLPVVIGDKLTIQIERFDPKAQWDACLQQILNNESVNWSFADYKEHGVALIQTDDNVAPNQIQGSFSGTQKIVFETRSAVDPIANCVDLKSEYLYPILQYDDNSKQSFGSLKELAAWCDAIGVSENIWSKLYDELASKPSVSVIKTSYNRRRALRFKITVD